MSWLQHVPAAERAALIGVVALVLGAPTVLLGRLEAPHRVADVVAVGAVAIAVGALLLEWRRHGAPGAARLAARRTSAESDRERNRSIAVSAWTPPETRPLDRLAARDPAFSLPVLLAAVSALLPVSGPAAAAEVVAVRERAGALASDPSGRPAAVEVDAVVRTPGGAVLAHVSCPTDARSPALADVPGAWRLDGTEPWTGAEAAIVADPGVAAARRALVARDALDLRALEALAWQISAALDAGDEASRPYVSEDGRADLAYWRAVGLPPDEGPTEWIEVEQDGWFDRFELAMGARVLSLRRATGRPEAPWELWRVRRRS